ncbi:TPA: hypothetical protein N0F65_010423, partial [Lagenidium giganteum]
GLARGESSASFHTPHPTAAREAAITARMQPIIDVDLALLDLSAVDEDDGEGVVISLLEFIFAETNAQYNQHSRTNHAIRALSSYLTDSIFDTIHSSQLAHEHALNHAIFRAETPPLPDAKDRHVARSVVIKTLEQLDSMSDKLLSSPSQQLRTDTASVRLMSKSRRRPKSVVDPVKEINSQLQPSTSTPTLPRVIDLGAEDDERVDVRQWRNRCLREIDQGKKKPLAKWAAVARAFAVMDEPKVSMDVELIDNATPLLKLEAAAPPSTIKTKASIDTFSAISNVLSIDRDMDEISFVGGGLSTRSITRDSVSRTSASKRSLLTNTSTVGPAPLLKKNSSVQLNDKLARKRSAGSVSVSATLNPWKFQTQAGSYKPENQDFSPGTMSSHISLEPGVTLVQGEARYAGPPQPDGGPQSMSRKRFDLHQRLAPDYMLQAAEREPIVAAPPSSSVGSPTLQRFVEVPAEPVIVPQLSPLSKTSLVIPRTHLSPSHSTPSLRVRSVKANPAAANSRAQHTVSTGRLATLQELPSHNKNRPATALANMGSSSKKLLDTTSDSARGTKPSAVASASKKYIREFPKPQAGVIKITTKAQTALMDDRQRLAWMTS